MAKFRLGNKHTFVYNGKTFHPGSIFEIVPDRAKSEKEISAATVKELLALEGGEILVEPKTEPKTEPKIEPKADISKFMFNPEELKDKSLDVLNSLVAERLNEEEVKKFAGFKDKAQAIAYLSQDFGK